MNLTSQQLWSWELSKMLNSKVCHFSSSCNKIPPNSLSNHRKKNWQLWNQVSKPFFFFLRQTKSPGVWLHMGFKVLSRTLKWNTFPKAKTAKSSLKEKRCLQTRRPQKYINLQDRLQGEKCYFRIYFYRNASLSLEFSPQPRHSLGPQPQPRVREDPGCQSPRLRSASARHSGHSAQDRSFPDANTKDRLKTQQGKCRLQVSRESLEYKQSLGLSWEG